MSQHVTGRHTYQGLCNTNDIENEMIFQSNTAFVFHDSRGFEAGSASELDKVKNFVQKCSTNQHLKDHLHVIW